MSEHVEGRGGVKNSGTGEIDRNGRPEGNNIRCLARENTQRECISNKAFKSTWEGP